MYKKKYEKYKFKYIKLKNILIQTGGKNGYAYFFLHPTNLTSINDTFGNEFLKNKINLINEKIFIPMESIPRDNYNDNLIKLLGNKYTGLINKNTQKDICNKLEIKFIIYKLKNKKISIEEASNKRDDILIILNDILTICDSKKPINIRITKIYLNNDILKKDSVSIDDLNKLYKYISIYKNYMELEFIINKLQNKKISKDCYKKRKEILQQLNYILDIYDKKKLINISIPSINLDNNILKKEDILSNKDLDNLYTELNPIFSLVSNKTLEKLEDLEEPPSDILLNIKIFSIIIYNDIKILLLSYNNIEDDTAEIVCGDEYDSNSKSFIIYKNVSNTSNDTVKEYIDFFIIKPNDKTINIDDIYIIIKKYKDKLKDLCNNKFIPLNIIKILNDEIPINYDNNKKKICNDKTYLNEDDKFEIILTEKINRYQIITYIKQNIEQKNLYNIFHTYLVDNIKQNIDLLGISLLNNYIIVATTLELFFEKKIIYYNNGNTDHAEMLLLKDHPSINNIYILKFSYTTNNLDKILNNEITQIEFNNTLITQCGIPCQSCLTLLKEKSINIFFTNNNGHIIKLDEQTDETYRTNGDIFINYDKYLYDKYNSKS